MNEISAARLSRKSQQLAIDEFQLIDLNMDLLKNTEENETVDSSKELTLKVWDRFKFFSIRMFSLINL